MNDPTTISLLSSIPTASPVATLPPVASDATPAVGADFVTDLAAIIDRISVENRVRDTHVAAFIISNLHRHLGGLALRAETEHNAGPLAKRLIKGVLDAVGTCSVELNAMAREWAQESRP